MNDSATGPGKKPLAVYAIIERKDRNLWFKIGAAFHNRDGSVNLFLDALPLGTNRLQVREQRAFDDARPAGADAAGPRAQAAEDRP